MDFSVARIALALDKGVYAVGRKREQDKLRSAQEGQMIMELKRALRVPGLRRDRHVPPPPAADLGEAER